MRITYNISKYYYFFLQDIFLTSPLSYILYFRVTFGVYQRVPHNTNDCENTNFATFRYYACFTAYIIELTGSICVKFAQVRARTIDSKL